MKGLIIINAEVIILFYGEKVKGLIIINAEVVMLF